jgi:hypothetical protein
MLAGEIQNDLGGWNGTFFPLFWHSIPATEKVECYIMDSTPAQKPQ